jgi:hypothetical protein
MPEQPVYGAPEKGDPSNNPDLRALAVKRLKAKQGFYVHATVYGLVNLLLVVIWVVTGIAAGAWFPWPVFPIFGWGIGLAMHGWGVFGHRMLHEERIQSEMQRLALVAQPQRLPD